VTAALWCWRRYADEFIWGDVTRISPEAPVPVVNIRRESTRLSGAGNVGRTCRPGSNGKRRCGGQRRGAEKLRDGLRQTGGVQTDAMQIADEHRPTTIKLRIIAHNQMVVRADREHRGHVNGAVEARIISTAREAIGSAQALVVSDYDKGVITPKILAEVLPLAYGRIPVLVDPKIRNFDAYRPANLVTPNHHEALRVANLDEDNNQTLQEAAQIIRSRLGCNAVLITRGEAGMMLVEGDAAPVYVETAAREVFDVTGAGDTVIATLAAALAAGASMTEAAVLANQAAGIVVGKVGTATATAEEVLNSIR
jgi:D-beta-D-heptose 7-phosphate kinase/D-beta-D-heptose 1-phosphate adenosyltransferase